MAFKIRETDAYNQEIADTSTVQNVELGTRVKAYDTTYGEATFIYLKGVASTAAGNTVVFDLSDWSTVRTVAGSRGAVGVAMSANVAGPNYGWYAIYGTVPTTCGTVADNTLPFSTATPGSIDDAVVTGDRIEGAVIRSANGTPVAGQCLLQLNYPFMNGNG
jgi:hypothetical protein